MPASFHPLNPHRPFRFIVGTKDMSGLRVLVTGFGAFPGVDHNYSTDLACAVCAALNATPAHQGRETITAEHAQLDVAWRSISQQLTGLYRQYRPTIAIHFGVCHSVTGLVIEQRAQNSCAPNLDVCDTLPASDVVQAGASAQMTTRLSVADITDACTNLDVAIAPSQNAGRYLCNAAYYISLSLAARLSPPGDALFVHMPDTLTVEDEEWPLFVYAARSIVTAAIGQHQRATR